MIESIAIVAHEDGSILPVVAQPGASQCGAGRAGRGPAGRRDRAAG